MLYPHVISSFFSKDIINELSELPKNIIVITIIMLDIIEKEVGAKCF